MRQGMTTVLTTGAEVFRPVFLTLLADTCRKIGQTAESLRLLEEAQQAMERHDARYIAAEIYRLKGEVLLQQQDAPISQALTYLQQALEVARSQHARALELRVALSLGRLWQLQGKGSAARQLVGEIASWFTEGLDTPDLQQARAFVERPD
jgi:predicted ATPase